MKLDINYAKNSILPLLCLSTIKPGIYHYSLTKKNLNNDALEIIDIFKDLNIKIYYKLNYLIIDSSCIIINQNLKVKKINIRAIYYLYTTLSVYKNKILFPKPKGCNIGNRKIDLHLDILRKFNIQINVLDDNIIIDSTKKKDIDLIYNFNKISVGATINAIFCSLFNKYPVKLNNCSIDPYIINIIGELKKFNVDISINKRQIIINPSNNFKINEPIRVIPDPIISVTYIILITLFKRKDIILNNLIIDNLGEACGLLKNIGINFNNTGNDRYYLTFDKLKSFNVETSEFPGIYTDVMPFLVILGSEIGNCSIKENIMNNRFKFAEQLKKIGMKYKLNNNKIEVYKNNFDLINNDNYILESTDLRGGMAILIYISLFLTKNPNSTVLLKKYNYLLRGYNQIEYLFNQFNILIKNYNNSEILVSSKPINLHSTLGL